MTASMPEFETFIEAVLLVSDAVLTSLQFETFPLESVFTSQRDGILDLMGDSCPLTVVGRWQVDNGDAVP